MDRGQLSKRDTSFIQTHASSMAHASSAAHIADRTQAATAAHSSSQAGMIAVTRSRPSDRLPDAERIRRPKARPVGFGAAIATLHMDKANEPRALRVDLEEDETGRARARLGGVDDIANFDVGKHFDSRQRRAVE